MLGQADQRQSMFCYISPEGFIPKGHPLRPMKKMVDAALKELSPKCDEMYSHTGRPSNPPDKLLKASLLQAFYSIRSERQLVEQIGYNILFRWFLDMALDEKAWDATVFTKNKDRLLKAEISKLFLAAIVQQAKKKKLLSSEHFTVDGTLIEAWASIKSFRPKDGPPSGPVVRNEEADFRGKKLSNSSHESVTDPDAKLCRKGNQQGADPYHMGLVLMENRHWLVMETVTTQANGTAEREAADDQAIHTRKNRQGTLGADKGYDAESFIETMGGNHVTPHLA